MEWMTSERMRKVPPFALRLLADIPAKAASPAVSYQSTPTQTSEVRSSAAPADLQSASTNRVSSATTLSAASSWTK